MLLFLLAGCSGYRFSQQQNPLSQYGINSLSVPMFYNYSNLAGVSSEFTRETYRLLTQFSGLKLNSGYNPKADAVLIGIIKGPEKLTDSMSSTGQQVAQTKAPEAIGTVREKFSVPVTNTTVAILHIIVIKKPSEEELALLKSGLGDKVRLNSKIIFNDIIPLSQGSTREFFDGEAVSITGTQNLGVQRRMIKLMAEQAAITIRDTLLYAF